MKSFGRADRITEGQESRVKAGRKVRGKRENRDGGEIYVYILHSSFSILISLSRSRPRSFRFLEGLSVQKIRSRDVLRPKFRVRFLPSLPSHPFPIFPSDLSVARRNFSPSLARSPLPEIFALISRRGILIERYYDDGIEMAVSFRRGNRRFNGRYPPVNRYEALAVNVRERTEPSDRSP